jgi:hypothetical protein
VNLGQLLEPPSPPDTLLEEIRRSPSAQIILKYLRAAVPQLADIPPTPYRVYRQYALTGEREGYEKPYFAKRSMLTRAVVETILEKENQTGRIQDLLWNICEESSWVLPAHEQFEPEAEAQKDPARPVGASSSLPCKPDYIDLFAAETASSLAETIYLLGEHLAPEVVGRVRQEIERRILLPYLTYGHRYWWHTGNLNWNAVCNGAVGLAFMRLETNPRRLAKAVRMVLRGFKAYLDTAFESDGGSLEGVGYWNYGLLYFVALAEQLRVRTSGQLDLLADPRLREIARFPLAMALAPGRFLNFGDTDERIGLQPGIAQRLAERTGVSDLRGLIYFTAEDIRYDAAKTVIVLRDIAWWDGQTHPFPSAAQKDYHLPACAVVKLNGHTPQGQPTILAAKAGSNDGHHYHTDIGQFIVAVNGESLLCDPGRGLYSRDYFSDRRFENLFCNSFGHSVPRIGGRLQTAGPRFGGGPSAEGTVVEYRQTEGDKYVVMEIAPVYGLPALIQARRTLRLSAATGIIQLEDVFEFFGKPLDIEEAFITRNTVDLDGAYAKITGREITLHMRIDAPADAVFGATLLEEACRVNKSRGDLTRITVNLPPGTLRFVLQIDPGTPAWQIAAEIPAEP